MVEVRAFHPDDVDLLDPTEAMLAAYEKTPDWRGAIRAAATSGPAWTAWLDGRVIGCAGILLPWPGRAVAWCTLARDIPKSAWIGIHRAVGRRLGQAVALGVRRLEADVAAGFEPGARWVRMLGFRHETLSEAYGPGGAAYDRFVKVF